MRFFDQFYLKRLGCLGQPQGIARPGLNDFIFGIDLLNRIECRQAQNTGALFVSTFDTGQQMFLSYKRAHPIMNQNNAIIVFDRLEAVVD